MRKIYLCGMKHLVIKNLGPVVKADIELKRINCIIGPQSSGKSCVLKTACYCSWVEKRIELAHNAEEFNAGNTFLDRMVMFYKLYGYATPDTFIMYESDCLWFSFDNSQKGEKFKFEWKDGEWDFRRPKVTYIPAERNLVAAVPNWYNVKLDDNYIREFMSEWSSTRKSAKKDLEVLNLGVKYHYEKTSDTDKVIEKNGRELDLENTSSGLQSLIPLFVYLDYINEHFTVETPESLDNVAENDALLKLIYEELFVKKAKTETVTLYDDIGPERTLAPIGRFRLWFSRPENAQECLNIYNSFTKTMFCDVFLEEPEENLFPKTQHDLICWLIGKCNEMRPHSLFIATHSPYIMAALNNLIEAGNVIAEDGSKRAAVEGIIPKKLILSYDEVGAYMIDDNGIVLSMMDEDSRLISADRLDSASDVISEEFSKLLGL